MRSPGSRTTADCHRGRPALVRRRRRRALAAIVEPGLDRDDRPPTRPSRAATRRRRRRRRPLRGRRRAFAWGNGAGERRRAGRAVRGDPAESRARPGLPSSYRLLFPYLQRRGRVAEMEVLGRPALRVARRLGDEAAEAYALVDLAGLHFLTGRAGEALALNDGALAIWRRLGASRGSAAASTTAACCSKGSAGTPSPAKRCGRAWSSRELGDPYGEAVTHSHLGNLVRAHRPAGRHRAAPALLALGDEMGDVIVRHSAHCNIGYAHLTARRTGRRPAALRGEPAHPRRPRRLARRVPDPPRPGPCPASAGAHRAGRPRVRRAAGPAPTPAPTATRAVSPATSRGCCCGRGGTSGATREWSGLRRWTAPDSTACGSRYSGSCVQRPGAGSVCSLRVGVALHHRRAEREPDRGVAEGQAARQLRGLPDRRGDLLGLLGGAVHDHLVVLEEDQLGGEVRAGAAQGGEQQQGPVGGAALDDEVAGEAAPGPGVR